MFCGKWNGIGSGLPVDGIAEKSSAMIQTEGWKKEIEKWKGRSCYESREFVKEAHTNRF